MAVLHFAVARAPGWRIARLFAGMALVAGIYSALNATYCIDGLSNAAYLTAGRLSYLTGTVQVVFWWIYAYSDANGSLRKSPRFVTWIAVSVLAGGLFFAVTGWLIKQEVSLVAVPWARVHYHYPLTTPVGDAYGLILLLLPAAAILRLLRRFRSGDESLGWQVILFALVWLFALEEVLVSNRMLNLPSLLDFGLLLLVMPFSYEVVQRIINDARRLRDLSEHLETEVVRRTSERDLAQKALREAEKDIGDLVASLDAIVWEADADTLEVTFVSEGARRLLGHAAEPSGLKPPSWQQYLHPDDRERVLAQTRKAVESTTTVSLEYRVLAEDGRVRWFRNYVHPVASPQGRSDRLRGIIVDVTESRHAHEAIIESEERFRSLFENSTVGIYRTTPDGRILMANPALLSLLGYSSFEELARRNLEKEGFEPGYARSTFHELMQTQGAVIGLEAMWTRQDGSALYIRESGRAVKAADGSILYYDGIVEDFTHRKQAEDAIRESEQRFRNIADTCPVIIWYGSPDRQITFLNRQATIFSGRQLDELLGDGWMKLVQPDDLPGLDSTLTSAISERSSFQIELRVRRYDGEYRWMLDTAVPRYVGDVFSGHTGIMVDITDLKRTQEQVLAAQKFESVGVLASGIAHDFNNMLGGVLAQTELLLSEIPAGSPIVEGIGGIKAIALRAAEIVRQLLAYAGNEGTTFEPVDLSRLVDEMLPLLGVSISKQSVIKTDLGRNLPIVRANAAQLRRVLMNLMTNASEALPEEGGEITVRTALVRREAGSVANGESERDVVRLEVSDTGVGMSEDIRARIFDPFFTTKFPGRGLGLAAVQGIVRSHGGNIQVTSAPGQGTRIHVSLPCVAHPAGGTATPEKDNAAFPTVLFVEDEELLRKATAKMLRRQGFSVLEADNGFDAVELFRANRSIEVILLDLTLPGQNGKDVFSDVRRIRPGVKVILTTAYSEDVAASAAAGHDNWAFIRKPYKTADLVKLLREVLSN